MVCKECLEDKSKNEFPAVGRTRILRDICNKCFHKVYHKSWRQTDYGFESRRLTQRKYRGDGIKSAAYQAVNNALLKGEIFRKKICAACFKEEVKTHFHHLKGYNKINHLDVVELCHPCHIEAHNELDHPFHPKVEIHAGL